MRVFPHIFGVAVIEGRNAALAIVSSDRTDDRNTIESGIGAAPRTDHDTAPTEAARHDPLDADRSETLALTAIGHEEDAIVLIAGNAAEDEILELHATEIDDLDAMLRASVDRGRLLARGSDDQWLVGGGTSGS